MRALPFLLAAALALAGCLGPLDDATGDENDSLEPASNESDDGPPDPSTSWETETRNGTINGTQTPLASTASAEERFNVTNGTKTLALNLTTEGGEVNLTVTPPGCESDDCRNQTGTEDGNLSFERSSPDAGEWLVEMEPAQAGPADINYTLQIAQEVPLTG